MRCIALLVAVQLLAGQDADTILLKDGGQKFSLVSQIQDPAEAAAFLAAVETREPLTRLQNANQFLKTYPRSWLLPQAYDLAARAAIDLAKYDEALSAGRFSLRLLPENPSLLVLMANMEAQQRNFQQASQDATDALDYLDQIERPANTSAKDWEALQPQLKASAYFARARANISRAFAENSAIGLDDLNRAAAWNSDDPEIFYLRAIVELRLHKNAPAAADLAFVYQSNDPLREKAKPLLLAFSKQSASFEDFLRTLPERNVDVSLRRGAELKDDQRILADGYAGPEACQRCHTKEYSAWRKTGMARMFQPYQSQNIIGDFSPGSQFQENGATVIRMGIDKRPYFELQSQRFYVDFTIGSKWQQGYATKLPDGRVHVLPIEYNLPLRKWINYWQIIDPPGSPRAVIQDFPKFTSATNYQQNCAICHTSQLKLPETPAASMEHAVYLQPGIDCEMCHGPSAWHVKQAAKGTLEHAEPTQPPFDFKKANNRDAVRVCAQCHRQSAVRDIGSQGEMNYSSKGTFVPATWQRPLDAFSRKAFYKDGRFRETTFIVEAFTRSACYRRGTAQCASCHSPHLDNFETNQTSLKYWNDPNEMCLTCHQAFRSRLAEHSRHKAGTEASRCVSCHMPRIMNALLFQARSHQIEIPSADLTQRFGQQESPNVCLTCHQDKGPDWAKEQLAVWPH